MGGGKLKQNLQSLLIKMKVSFVIVNYNGRKTLKKCIQSILNQRFPKNQMEVIVIDNNSPDKSWRLVEKNKKIKLIRCKKNGGFAKGNNIGIKKSSGEYVALINNDVVIEKDWLRKMFAKIKDKDVGIVGCKILYSSSNKVWFGGGKIYFPGFARHLNLKEERYVDYIAFAAVLLDKKIFSRGYLDENLFMYGEDSELCKRIKGKGFKILYYPGTIAYHCIKNNRISNIEEYYIQRNRAYYYTKFYGFLGKRVFLIGDLLLFFPLFAIYRVIKNPKRIKFWKEILKARLDSIKLILK